MSDVIRNAIIKLGIQVSNPDLKMPDLKPAIQQQESLTNAVKAADSATKAAAESTQKLEAAQDASTVQSGASATAKLREIELAEYQAKALNKLTIAELQYESASGRVAASTLGVARGMAMMAVGSNDSLSALLPLIVHLEGMRTVASNVASVQSNLAAAYRAAASAGMMATLANISVAGSLKALWGSLGPVYVALLALEGVIWLTTKAWDALTVSSEEQEDATRRLREEHERIQIILDAGQEYYDTLHDSQFQHIELLKTEAEKLKTLNALMTAPLQGGDSDFRLKAAREQSKIYDDLIKKEEDRKKKRLEALQVADRDLQKAKEALKVEDDRSRSLRASIGALTKGEQNKLGKAIASAEAGTLTQKQAIELGRFGDAGRKASEGFLQGLDKGLGQRLESLATKATGDDPRAKAQAEFERKAAAALKETGGKSAEAARKAIEDQSDAIVKSIGQSQDAIVKKIGEFIDAVNSEKLERNNRRTTDALANRSSK